MPEPKGTDQTPIDDRAHRAGLLFPTLSLSTLVDVTSVESKEALGNDHIRKEATDETKSRYAFVYGDFRRVLRTGLVACQYRAAEWRHKEIELAAHTVLQLLDKTTA